MNPPVAGDGADGQAPLLPPDTQPVADAQAPDSEQEEDSGDEASEQGDEGRGAGLDPWTVPTHVRATAGRQLYNGSGQNNGVDPVEAHAARLAIVNNPQRLNTDAKAKAIMAFKHRNFLKPAGGSKTSRICFDVRPILGQQVCLQIHTVVVNGSIALFNNSLHLVEFIPIFTVPPAQDRVQFEAEDNVTPQVDSYEGWPVGGLEFSPELINAVRTGSGKLDPNYVYTWPLVQRQQTVVGKKVWETVLCIHSFLNSRMNGGGVVEDWPDFLNFTIFPGKLHQHNIQNDRLDLFYQNQQAGIPMPHLPDMDPARWGEWAQWQALWGPVSGAKEDETHTWAIPMFTWLLMLLPTAMVSDPDDRMGTVTEVTRRVAGTNVLPDPVSVNFPFLAATTCYPEIAELVYRIVKSDPTTELIMLSDPRVGPVHQSVTDSWEYLRGQCEMMMADTAVFHLLTVVPDVIRRGAELAREPGPTQMVFRGVEKWRYEKLYKEHQACGRTEMTRLRGSANPPNWAPLPSSPPFPAGSSRPSGSAPNPTPHRPPTAAPRGGTRLPYKDGVPGSHYSPGEVETMLTLFERDRILLGILEEAKKVVNSEPDPDKTCLPAMAQEIRAAWIESQRSRLQIIRDRAQPLSAHLHTNTEFATRVKALVADIQKRVGSQDGREAVEPGPDKDPSSKDFKNMLPNASGTAVLTTVKQQEQYLAAVRHHLRKEFSLSALVMFAQCVSEAFGASEHEQMAERSRRMYEDIGEPGMDVRRARALFVDCCNGLDRLIHPPMTLPMAQKIAQKMSISWDPKGLADAIREIKRLGRRVQAFDEPRFECVDFPEGPSFIAIDPAVELLHYHVVRNPEYVSVITASPRMSAWTLGELYLEVAKRSYHLRGTRSLVAFSERAHRVHRAPYDVPPSMTFAQGDSTLGSLSSPQEVPRENRCTFEFLCKGGPMSHYLLRSPPEIHDRLDCHNLKEAARNAGFWDTKYAWDRPNKSFIDRFLTFCACASANDPKRVPYPWVGQPSASQVPMNSRFGPSGAKGNGGKGGNGGGGKGGKSDKEKEKGGQSQTSKPQQGKEENPPSATGSAKTAQVTEAPVFSAHDIRLDTDAGCYVETWSGGVCEEVLGGGGGLSAEAPSFIPSSLARVNVGLPPLPCAGAWGEEYLSPLTRLASRARTQVFSGQQSQEKEDPMEEWDPALDPLLNGVEENPALLPEDEDAILQEGADSTASSAVLPDTDSPASPDGPRLLIDQLQEPLTAPLDEGGDSTLTADRRLVAEFEAGVNARMAARASEEREKVADAAADETVLAAGSVVPPAAPPPAPPAPVNESGGDRSDEPMDTASPPEAAQIGNPPAPPNTTLPTPPPHKAFLGVPPAHSTPGTPDPAELAGPSGQADLERQARALAEFIQKSWAQGLSPLGGSSFLRTREPTESLAAAVRAGPASPTEKTLAKDKERQGGGGAIRHHSGLPARQSTIAQYGTARCYKCEKMGHIARHCPGPAKPTKNASPMKRPVDRPEREERGRDRRREDRPADRGGSRSRDPPPSPASRRPSGSSAVARVQSAADKAARLTKTAARVAAISEEVATLGQLLGDSTAPTRAIERGTGWTLSLPNVGASEDSPVVGGCPPPLEACVANVKGVVLVEEFTIRGVSVWAGGERVMLYNQSRTYAKEVLDGGSSAAAFVADAHTALVPGKPHAKHPCPSVVIVINGVPVRAILDTGATSSLVGDFLRVRTSEVWPWRTLENPVQVLIADGSLSTVSEAANVSMSWNGIVRPSSVLYMKGLKDMMLFGMESAHRFGDFTICRNPEEPDRYTAVPTLTETGEPAVRRCLLPPVVKVWIDEANDARRRCGRAFCAVYSLPVEEFSPPQQDIGYAFALEWREGQYHPPADFHRLLELAERRESVAFRSQECHGLEYPGKASREILEPNNIPRGAIQIYAAQYAELLPLTAAPVLCRIPPTGEWLVCTRPDPFLYYECTEAVVSGEGGNEQWLYFRNESHHLTVKIFVGSYVAIAVPVSTVEVEKATPKQLRRIQVDDEDAEWGLVQPEAPQPSWPSPESVIGDLDLSYLAKAGLSEERIRSILLAHKGVVMRHKGDLGLLRYGHHEIELTNETPFLDPPRRLNPARLEALREIIDRGLENGTFAPSKSAWASPIVLVKKKDGSLRLCIDYRTLNRRTTPDTYPLPRIDSILDACSRARFFMCLDLGTAFWQIRMSDRAAEVAAFVTPLGLFQPTRMPMGPRNGPATFQRVMDRITLGLEGVQSYIDDLLVVGRTEEELYQRFQSLLSVLEEAGAKLRADKCCFGAVELEFLGFHLSRAGITPPPKHVNAILDIELPTTLKEVQRFVGCCNFFRGLIPSFATVAKPLTDAMRGCKKGQKIVITDEVKRSFQQLKDILAAYPLICYPDHKKPFTLITDASGVAVGSALLQRSDEGVLQPIGYMSRRLSPVQERWDTTERELYAMVAGFEYFQVYLLGREDTVVITDHRPLKALDSLRSSKPKIWRWLLYLEDFRPFHVEFRPGKENLVADLLSRAFLARVKGPVIDKDNKSPPPPIPKLFETAVKTAQANDPFCQEISALMRKTKGLNKADKERRKKYEYVGDLLCVRPKKKEGPSSRLRVFIPPSLVRYTVEEAHNDDVHGHVGADRLFKRLHQLLFASDLRRHVEEVTRGCGTCAKYRPSAWKYEDTMRSCVDKDAPRLFGGWSIDLCSFPHGKNTQHLCVCVEWLTRYAEVVPLKDKSAESVCAALLSSVIPRYGCPDVILTDQGTEFCNQLVNSIFMYTGTTHLTTTPYTAAANGIVERKNREIKEALTRVVRDDPGQWPTWVPLVMLLLNTREPSKGKTGLSPFELLFQATPQLPNPTMLDELVAITAQQQRGGRSSRDTIAKIREWAHQELVGRNEAQNSRHNEMIPVVEWQIGDVVFVRVEAQDKMAPRASGPFLVWALSQSKAQLSLLDANAPDRPPAWVSASRCSKVGYVEFQAAMSREDWAAATLASHGATQVTVFPPAAGPPPPVQARAPSRKMRSGEVSRCDVSVRKNAYRGAGRGGATAAVAPPAVASAAPSAPLPPPVAQVLPQPMAPPPGAQPPNEPDEEGGMEQPAPE